MLSPIININQVVKNIKSILNTKVNGKTTKKTDLEYKFFKMETSMKVNGKTIKDMVKELYGEKILKVNLLESI